MTSLFQILTLKRCIWFDIQFKGSGNYSPGVEGSVQLKHMIHFYNSDQIFLKITLDNENLMNYRIKSSILILYAFPHFSERIKPFVLMLWQVRWGGRMGDLISRTQRLNQVLLQFGDLWPHYHYNNFLFPMSCSKQIKPCIQLGLIN